MRAVLQALFVAGLYANLDKCLFGVTRVPFLGFILTSTGIEMEEDRISTVQSWPIPECIREIQIFIGFVNFYRRFIEGFSRRALGLTNMLKGTEKVSKKTQARKQENFLTDEARNSFHELIRIFTTAPFLVHFDSTLRIRVETDASGFAISGIITQLHESGWRVVAYYSRKMLPAERNYETHDGELLAIVESFRHWRHYLEGSTHSIEVLTDHGNLRSFMTTHTLSRRQVRWMLTLSSYDFQVVYRKGPLNPADAPSRRPDYQQSAELEDAEDQNRNTASLRSILFPNVAAITHLAPRKGSEKKQSTVVLLPPQAELCDTAYLKHVMLQSHTRNPVVMAITSRSRQAREAVEQESTYEDISQTLLESLPEFLRVDPLARMVREKLASLRTSNNETNELSGWTQLEELLYFHQALYIPHIEALRQGLLRVHHDGPLAGHLATDKTYNLLRRKYYWPKMKDDIGEYCNTCLVCQGGRVIREKPQGQMQSLPLPDNPWDIFTMDFLTGLPMSESYGGFHNAILVVVDVLTKMCHYIPVRKDLTAGQLAEVILREVIRLHGIPLSIVSDRGSLFTSRMWANLMYALKIERRLSTAFHPQTDGQTERQNSTLEQYFRSYVNYTQDNWSVLLPLAEFAYNSSIHSSTGKVPFEVNYGYIPRSDMVTTEEVQKYTAAKGISAEAEVLTDTLRNTRKECQQALTRARQYQKTYYDKHHTPKEFAVGQKVWLNVKNITLERPARKLDWQRYGPFRVIKRLGKQAYELELPELLRIHPVFHISLLREHKPRFGQEDSEPEPLRLAVDPDQKEFTVDGITGSRWHSDAAGKRTFQYLVAWKGYEDMTWEPAAYLLHAKRLVNKFHKVNPSADAPDRTPRTEPDPPANADPARKKGRPRRTVS